MSPPPLDSLPKTRRRWTRAIAIGLAVVLACSFMMSFGYASLERLGMQPPAYVALGILLIAAVLWITEAIELFVTSLIVLWLAVVWLSPVMSASGLSVDRADFFSPFFSDVIVLFLGGFALSAALRTRRLDQWIAGTILSRTGSTLPSLLFAIMVVTAFLSMWLSNTATAAMMLAMVLPITANLDSGDDRGKALLLAVPFAANIGGLGTPIGSPPNAIAMQYMNASGIAPSFAGWLIIGIPGVVGMLGLAWAYLYYRYRRDGESLPMVHRQVSVEIDWQFWLIIATVMVTIAGWMTTTIHGHSSGTVALIPVIVFFATGILRISDLQQMSWEVLLMMGGGLCLGAVIGASGLADWMVAQLPVTGVSLYALTFCFAAIACAMSSVMSNTATANLLLPIIIGMNLDSPATLMIGTAFGCSLAMPLPISTPPNAMAFSSGKIRVKDLAVPGFLLSAIGVILSLTVGYWWWHVSGIVH
ncbi:SLC13 family permease [Roseiconus lacunae]|uniref:SLC13 family permease n=1 Tax=Roseiconus lacunae TaxID=2605694 RepID=UPI0011F12643|nr:SLC13 family permease [Roseiconus lacunae]MCD0462975.1 SLC13 family permease [Roseiconus lacunae]WRQ49084.1 SLC13 family permease [Stieleria sp. HD01]